MISKKKIAVLVSGGLDSAILIHYYLKKKYTVQPIYVSAKHVWENAELYWLKRFLNTQRSSNLKPLALLSFHASDLYQTHWSVTGKKIPGAKTPDRAVYIPGKNLLLISKATVFCALRKIPEIALAPLNMNPFNDATPDFFHDLEKVCSKGLNFKIKIRTPFRQWNKNKVINFGKKLPLELTFSCLSPRETAKKKYLHCGKCGKCAERKKAFKNTGLRDLTPYAI